MPKFHHCLTALAAILALLIPPTMALADVQNAPKGNAQRQISEQTKPDKATAKNGPKKSENNPNSERIAQALRQDYEPNPAIWRLADDDTTIYLFGTIHILPKGFRWRSDALEAVIAEADELVLESTEDDDDMAGMITGIIGTMLEATAERGPLSSLLDEENRPKLEKLSGQIGIPNDMIEIMPVWLLSFFTFYDAAEDYGSINEYGVETVLTADFKEKAKPISAIEDASAVMAAMSAVDETEMVAELNSALSAWDGEGPLFGTVEESALTSDPAAYFADDHGWAQGRTSAMEAGLSREELGDAFYNVLLVDRNRAWAEWLDQRLEQPGTVLVAVGAGHLAGPDSVQVMLDQRGLATERIR